MNSLSSKLQLSAADRALLEGTTGADLPSLGPPPITLNQPLSPAVLPGEGRVKDATVGGWIIPWNDERIAALRFRSLIFGFTEDFREYRPNRGGLVRIYPEMPDDAHFHRDRTPKGHYRDSNDNQVEDTIHCFQLIVGLKSQPFAGVFRFARSALEVGRELSNRAHRLKVEGENISGMVIGLWEWTSRLAPGANSTSFYLPVSTLLGKLGEPTGPPLAQVRLAAQLRQKFKEGLPWAPEAPAPPAELEKPAPRQGSVTITSGKQALDDERSPLPDRYDGPDGDDIPF